MGRKKIRVKLKTIALNDQQTNIIKRNQKKRREKRRNSEKFPKTR